MAEEHDEEAEAALACILLFSRYDKDRDDRIDFSEFSALVGDLMCLKCARLDALLEDTHTAQAIAQAAFPELVGAGKEYLAHEPPFTEHPFVALRRRWRTPALEAFTAGMFDLHDPELIGALDGLKEARSTAAPLWVYAPQPGFLNSGQPVPEEALHQLKGWHFVDHGDGEGIVYWWPPEAERAAEATLIAHPVRWADRWGAYSAPPPPPPPILNRRTSTDDLPPAPHSASARLMTAEETYVVVNRRLDELGYEPLDLGGEGDCFFRVLAHAIFGNEEMHYKVRLDVAKQLRDTPDLHTFSDEELAPFGGTVEGYIQSMSQRGTYVEGQREMLAASLAYRRRFYVFGLTLDHDQYEEVTHPAVWNEVGPLPTVCFVHYHTGDGAAHYVSLRVKDGYVPPTNSW